MDTSCYQHRSTSEIIKLTYDWTNNQRLCKIEKFDRNGTVILDLSFDAIQDYQAIGGDYIEQNIVDQDGNGIADPKVKSWRLFLRNNYIELYFDKYFYNRTTSYNPTKERLEEALKTFQTQMAVIGYFNPVIHNKVNPNEAIPQSHLLLTQNNNDLYVNSIIPIYLGKYELMCRIHRALNDPYELDLELNKQNSSQNIFRANWRKITC